MAPLYSIAFASLTTSSLPFKYPLHTHQFKISSLKYIPNHSISYSHPCNNEYSFPSLATVANKPRRHTPLLASPSSIIPSLITSAKLPTFKSIESIFYMILLAIQFGIQPILTKRYTPKTINRSTVVLSQDITKFILAFFALLFSGSWTTAIAGWTLKSWLTVACIPAALYCVQNFATLIAYQNLAPLTFNVLNQTKTLSAALCCFLIMGKVQSQVQIGSLIMLFLSACVIEKVLPLEKLAQFLKSKKVEIDQDSIKSDAKESLDASSDALTAQQHSTGVIAVLLASFISGLAGAFTQKSLQRGIGPTGVSSTGRNSYFFTMELCVASILVLLGSLMKSDDGKRIRENGFFDKWTPQTLIPIVTNAAGGIVVGLVTKHAGAVKKGFALIFGLLLSGVLQAKFLNEGDGEKGVSTEQIIGGTLAALSLYMHSAYPPKK